MADPEPPIDGDRSSSRADDPAGHDDAVGTAPAAGDDEISVAGLREPPAVETNEPIREETAELWRSGRARDAPIRAEHEAADAGQIEILVNHLAEIGRLRGQRQVGADHRDRLVAESADKRDRRVVSRAERDAANTPAMTVRARMKPLANSTKALPAGGFTAPSCCVTHEEVLCRLRSGTPVRPVASGSSLMINI